MGRCVSRTLIRLAALWPVAVLVGGRWWWGRLPLAWQRWLGHDAAFQVAAGVSAGGCSVAVIAAADAEDLARVSLPAGLSRLLIGVPPGLVDVRAVRVVRGQEVDNPRFGRVVGGAAAGHLQARAWRLGAKAAVVPAGVLAGDIGPLFAECW